VNPLKLVVQLPLNEASVRLDGESTFLDLTLVRNPIDVNVVKVVAVDQQL
jgi:hypothetical protein